MKPILAVAIALIVGIQPIGAQAAAILNGSFELDPQANGTWGTYSDLVGWTGGRTLAGVKSRAVIVTH